ncbi:QWRF motif-containing protein 2-like, partial [Trifolium medium]|nr:QWRF motif-containing protein 2-like [Trifolium medium]
PARFWQEATNPLRRQVDLPSPRNGGNGNKLIVPPKLLVQKKSVLDSPAMSPRGIVNNRLQGSPIRSAVRPA